MDQVNCNKCGKNSIPRLWNYRPAFGNFRYMKTQHQCPFCGTCMYETGGQLSVIGELAFVLFIIPTVTVIIASILKHYGTVGNIAANVLIISVLIAGAYWLYIKVRFFIKSVIGK